MTRLATERIASPEMLSFFHLIVFETVMRLKSVTLAAEALDIPQSSLSRNLRALREHFGDALFVRTRTGMEPTSVAQVLVKGVIDALDVYRTRLTGYANFDAASSERNFSIASSDLGHLYILPLLHRHCIKAAPNIHLTAVPLGSAKLVSQLESGEVDIAVGSFPKLFANIREQTLFRDEYICIVPRALAPSGRLSMAQFKSAQHIVVDGHHQEVEKQVLDLAGRQNVRVISSSFVTSGLIAEQSDLILTVPMSVALVIRSERSAIALPPVDLPCIDVKQYWHERCDNDSGNMWLRSIIARARQEHARDVGALEPNSFRLASPSDHVHGVNGAILTRHCESKDGIYGIAS